MRQCERNASLLIVVAMDNVNNKLCTPSYTRVEDFHLMHLMHCRNFGSSLLQLSDYKHPHAVGPTCLPTVQPHSLMFVFFCLVMAWCLFDAF